MGMGSLQLPAECWSGDIDAQLVGGDAPAVPVRHKGRMAWAFDTVDEEAIVSCWLRMPSTYAAGTLTARMLIYMASATSSNVVIDVFVEAFTPDSDNVDLEAATSWDSANSVTKACDAHAGDAMEASVVLTNKDSVAAGDWFRIGVRRDCDSGDDAAAGDMYFGGMSIVES